MIRFGIPAESTDHIIQLSKTQNSIFETTDNEVLISLPALFKQYITTPHGLVIKFSVSSDDRKITLLTPKIEKDMEIPDENIHHLPQIFLGPFVFFKGVYFNDGKPVFIINTEKLKESIK